jgi:hypothetical protein
MAMRRLAIDGRIFNGWLMWMSKSTIVDII